MAIPSFIKSTSSKNKVAATPPLSHPVGSKSSSTVSKNTSDSRVKSASGASSASSEFKVS
ncbi:hypothetical protein BG011_007599, partial [Mortierella polycephala]